nr:MAG TPA: tail-collar fiber protein [Caudoviricetes sp.]
MATWKQENIMLTKVGEQALSSAEAGTGKITITKIVGSDFNPSDIYNASSTSAINNNLVFNIVEKKPVDSTTGTTIVIQATNKNVTAKFRMNSIVVFATQSSISSGEFPYMIAKTLNADEVDIPTNTPVTLNFALTILNTRGGLLNLTISNTGFVPIPTYLVDMQDYQNNVNAFGVTTGSAVTQRISSQFLNDHPITLKDGVSVKVKLGYNLKANSTLNVAGTGDKQILDVTGNTIPDDTFTQGSMLNLMYDTARNAWIVTGGEVLTASNGIQKVGKDMQLVDSGTLTRHIKDKNITTAKLADKSVTPEKLSDDITRKLDDFYVKKSGDNMTGDLAFGGRNAIRIYQKTGGAFHTITDGGSDGTTPTNLDLGSYTTTPESNLCCYHRPGWYGKDRQPVFKPLMTLQDISVTYGNIRDGQTLPIPSGFSEDECTWLLSIDQSNANKMYYDIKESGTANMFNTECWREGRKVHAGTRVRGLDGISPTRFGSYTRLEDGQEYWVPGTANYICIAVKKA